MKLSVAKVKNAKPKSKSYKLSDGKGMYLLVTAKGTKLWRMDYSFNSKRNTHSLGTYPVVSLEEARKRLIEAKQLIDNDVDPNFYRKTTKANTAKNTFEAVAKEWHAKFSPNWSQGHSQRILRRLEKDIIPWLGTRQICEIKAPELLTVMQRAENRGALETAHRIRQNCGQIFRYAVATGRAEYDISAFLKGALPPVIAEHHASITDPKKIGTLLRAIDGYEGEFSTRCALKLAPMVFLRPGELRRAEWSEFDLKKNEWRIPAEKMKMRAPHIIPLSNQVLLILSELQPLTGAGKYLFPSIRSTTRPMSENTINGALRRLGYTKDEMTGHGFRSIASTLLNEMGWKPDVIERQLAHSERNKVRAAYNYAEHLPERRKMMQAWADYLEQLKNNS
ncbi:MAG: hypothetical protein methR_P2748 [Methyloprofundus sp.]|nr:MAG: hypothetical protein methR_P2748 [Methyloprofundus sp.]